MSSLFFGSLFTIHYKKDHYSLIIIPHPDPHTIGEGVNSTTIQCVNEQSLTGICIFPVFYLLPMDNLCTNR